MNAFKPAPIIINGRFLSKPNTGVTRVGRELLRALMELTQSDPRYRVEIRSAPATWPAQGDTALSAPNNIAWRNGPSSMFSEQLNLPFQARNAALLCFCNVFPFLTPRPIVWLHDAHVLDTPESYEHGYRLRHKILFRMAIIRRIPIVTVSNYSKSRLVHHGAEPDQITVIASGGDHLQRVESDPSALFHPRLQGRRFVLLIGSRAPHKNLPFAVEALSSRLDPDIMIAVAGLHQAGKYQCGKTMSGGERVIFLPQQSDGQLRALYGAASAVVVPSLMEGFGLPVVEAMWETTPLVLSDRTALPEVGGDAALYFDPTDADAIASAVSDALEPATATRLRTAASRRRDQFTWKSAAERTLALVESVDGLQSAEPRHN